MCFSNVRDTTEAIGILVENLIWLSGRSGSGRITAILMVKPGLV